MEGGNEMILTDRKGNTIQACRDCCDYRKRESFLSFVCNFKASVGSYRDYGFPYWCPLRKENKKEETK
jgi:hypothetical protein